MVVREEAGHGGGGTGRFEWSTVPMAHSPQGFAALPFPWQEAKAQALKARRALGAKPGTAIATSVKAAFQAPGPAVSANSLAAAAGPDWKLDWGPDWNLAGRRTAELYQMLFHPYRHREITLVDLRAGKNDRAAAGPSVQLWLDYFAKARIAGVGQQAADIRDDRYSHHQCDLANRAALQDLCAGLPVSEIVIDHACHASLHQQSALLALFPKLASGGLYIVQGLRASPEAPEIPGFTRTDELLRGFSESRTFTHSDPAMAQAFAALKPGIAGCFLFQVGLDKRQKDQVAVLHKA